ncbi:14405_t:CDS:2, partial [Entrophospora sp. SA101]
MLENSVEIDETFIGGKNKNRHRDKKEELKEKPVEGSKGFRKVKKKDFDRMVEALFKIPPENLKKKDKD